MERQVGKEVGPMMEISAYSAEQIKDPFGILPGARYEFYLDLEVDEDDELYSEQGLAVRVVFSVEEARSGIVKYELLERSTEKYLDYELEAEELEAIESFCREHLP